MRRLLPLLALALAAGAVAAGAALTGEPGPTSAPAAQELEPAGLPDQATFHLGGGWELTRTEPTSPVPQRLDAGNFYASWAQGRDQPTWRGSALEESLHVTGSVDLPGTDEAESRRFEGVLAGSAYAADAGPVTATHPLDVPDSAARVDVQLGSQGAGVRDIDLALLGPDGETVAQSVTPHPEEGIVLHTPTIQEVGTGGWTIEVTNYGHAAVEYAVEASVGAP